jgi:hypothetical protein
MLLMGAGDWLQTSDGFWRLRAPHGPDEPPALLCAGKEKR